VLNYHYDARFSESFGSCSIRAGHTSDRWKPATCRLSVFMFGKACVCILESRRDSSPSYSYLSASRRLSSLRPLQSLSHRHWLSLSEMPHFHILSDCAPLQHPINSSSKAEKHSRRLAPLLVLDRSEAEMSLIQICR
jgi:hypothetical protein